MNRISRYSTLRSDNNRINVRLNNFHFFHRPITDEEDEVMDDKYMEPRNASHQLYNWIRHNKADSGTYLVTGYRGAGKSSFVGTLLRKLKAEDGRKYLSLFVNFGQENIEELEILRIIAKRLHSQLTEKYEDKYSFYKTRIYLARFFLAVFIAGVSLFVLHAETSWNCNHAVLAAVALIAYLLFSPFKPSPLIRAILRLKELTERLHATIETETTREFSLGENKIWKALGLRNRKSQSKAPATVQEIEYDLTEILELLKKDEPQRKIIIVFDELDKTDSSGRRTQSDELPEFEKLSIRPEQKISSRSRRQEVLRIIANMKFFLSSAKAYFIFIAGREMYEAFQADMSDRDFSINSIFNGVININSFLNSTRNANNTAQKTEEFVCRQLLPKGFEETVKNATHARYNRQNIFVLKNYYYYVAGKEDDFYADEITPDGQPDREARRKRVWRQVMALYRFVHYLTYISNGSPKKLTLFFEKNVRQGTYLKQEDKIGDVRYYRNGELQPASPKDDEAFYLSFGYYTQEKINFIHYLTYPIMQSLINRSNLYGDKLLVSASFLISHLFKLHNCGFSWRNLEQVPELLEINKTPEMREYIGSIIDFMNHTHLTTIPFGLYHYKFPMKISEEISFHSKLSGEVSALFNFSQDDIRGIREHYIRLIKGNGTENDATRYARASVHHTLGDLSMMEENYSNAIFEYEKSLEIISPFIEELKAGGGKIQDMNYIAFLNRTMLKLGLAHEKRRTDNSAFILYTELAQTLQGLSEKAGALFGNVRTMHLCLLARLYTIEKINAAGIQREDIEEALSVFKTYFKGKNNRYVAADFYSKMGDILYYKNQKFSQWFGEEFSAGSMYRKSMSLLLESNLLPCFFKRNECHLFCSEALKIRNRLSTRSDMNISQPEDTPRDNVIYQVALCLENLGHVSVMENCQTRYAYNSVFLTAFSDAVKNSTEDINFTPSNNLECALLYYWTASRLYNISCERGLSTNCHKEMMYIILTYLRNMNESSGVNIDVMLNLCRNVARHFFISRYRQYEHIHLSESDILQWMQGLEMYQNINLPDLSVFPDMEEVIYIYYTFELCLYHKIPKEKRKGRPEIVESLKSFYRSELMTGKRPCCTLVSTVHNLKLKSRFNEQLLCNLLNSDAEELEMLNFSELSDYVYGNIDDPLALCIFPETNNIKGNPNELGIKLDLLEYLITDGIFCLSRILELIIPLRNTTLFSNSFKADIYTHLVRFNMLYRLLYCYYYYGCNPEHDKQMDEFLKRRNKYRKVSWNSSCSTKLKPLRPAGNFLARRIALFMEVKRVTRKNNPTHTHVNFLAENGIHYYTKARQLHLQGKSYQELIRNLFFLDDDLKNDTLQFYMAMERFEIAHGKQSRKENRLKRRYSDNIAYQIDKYLGL